VDGTPEGRKDRIVFFTIERRPFGARETVE
jgi:hypothetical protein